MYKRTIVTLAILLEVILIIVMIVAGNSNVYQMFGVLLLLISIGIHVISLILFFIGYSFTVSSIHFTEEKVKRRYNVFIVLSIIHLAITFYLIAINVHELIDQIQRTHY